jgi:hypothetical protein
VDKKRGECLPAKAATTPTSEHGNTGTARAAPQYWGKNQQGAVMRAMIIHFALGAAATTGLGKPVAYRFPSDDPQARFDRTIIEVENTRGDDAEVYAFQGLRVHRLGRVHGMTITQFELPPEFLFDQADLRFSVGTAKGKEAVSDSISVESGEKVNLFIPPM